MTYSVEPPPARPDGYRQLAVGDLAPWFEQNASSGGRVQLDACAGRFLLLCLFVTAADRIGQQALAFAREQRELCARRGIEFYGVSIDFRDRTLAREACSESRRMLWDFDLTISRKYGAVPVDAAPGQLRARRAWCLLDPSLRIRAWLRFERDGSEQARLLEQLQQVPTLEAWSESVSPAPLLALENVLEPELCAELMRLHRRGDARATGFLREVDGKTVEFHEPEHKRRLDYLISDPALCAELDARLARRVVPELQKAYQFRATRIERHLLGCYRAEHGGHFSAHRDNTTRLTAHRRFAVSLNLNDDFDGGEIGFPEYGARRYKPKAGSALVFSCSLLHSVSPVTRGDRYAFLPFLHDEAAQLELERVLGAQPPAR